jgi:membrane-associated protease RseP (regulator of RpoE activity)
MRRTVLIGMAAILPLTGVALIARLARAAEPPQNPPKTVAPKDVAPPKDGAPPKDVAPPKDQPRAVAPKDNPRPTTSKDPRDPAPTPAPAAKAHDDIPNARDSKPNARDTIPNARDNDPKARNTIPNARDANRDAHSTARGERRSTRDLGITFGRFNERGLTVSDLAATSLLYRSGLRSGDYIASINGHRLERSEDFDRWVYAVDNNERIKVIVWRDSREEVVYLEPTIFYADESYSDDYTYFGVVFDDRYPDRLIVIRVYPDSPAFLAGLRPGDEIVTWHGQRVTSPREFGRLIHRIEPGNVDFEIARDSKTMRTQAKFSERVATKPSTQAGPSPDVRNPPVNPGAAPGPSPAPSPAPGPRTSPTPAPRSAPPAVRPNQPGTPAPIDLNLAPRRPM